MIIYTLSWLFFLLFLYKKNHKIGVSGLIVTSYIVYAIISILLYNDDLQGAEFKTLKAFPFVYLFGMLYLSLLPVIRYDRAAIERIEMPNMFILNSFSVVFIMISIILLPGYLAGIKDGIVMLILDPYGGADLYKEAHEAGAAVRTYLDIPFILFSMFSYIAVIVFFYYLTIPNSNRTVLYGLAISMFVNLLSPISRGLRTETMLMLFAIVAAYILLKKWIPKKKRRLINILGSAIGGVVIMLLIILTISRVSSKDVGAGGSVLEYVGQANLNFNNYGLDAGGIRYGDRTCRIFKEILMFDRVPSGSLERRSKYSGLLIDDYYFYTFVGDFTIDFGPIISVFIFIFFSWFFVNSTKVRRKQLSFSKLLLLYLAVLIPFQGGMYLFNFSDGGNYTLMAFTFMAIVFSISKNTRTQVTNGH